MPEAVYRMLLLLSTPAQQPPVRTNLGLLHASWMLVSRQLPATREVAIPGFSACGLSTQAVPWAALGRGSRARAAGET
jgi:hypothetical protein